MSQEMNEAVPHSICIAAGDAWELSTTPAADEMLRLLELGGGLKGWHKAGNINTESRSAGDKVQCKHVLGK